MINITDANKQDTLSLREQINKRELAKVNASSTQVRVLDEEISYLRNLVNKRVKSPYITPSLIRR